MPAKKPAYEGRHRTDAGDAPAKRGTKPATPTRRRGAQHEATTPKAPAAPKAPHASTSRRRDALDQAQAYAGRAALRAPGGPPSITGRAAAGAAGGAAAGAPFGAPGVAAGAVLGGTGGALAGRKAKKAYKAARNASIGARRIIVVEFLLCMTVAALSPLTDRKKDEQPGTMMKRLSAIMGLFLVLGLVSAGGRSAARLAAGFGGLVTVALALSNRDVFLKLAGVVGAPPQPDEDTIIKAGARGERTTP